MTTRRGRRVAKRGARGVGAPHRRSPRQSRRSDQSAVDGATRDGARARGGGGGGAGARELADAAGRRASHAREVLARSKRRATRLRAFQLWRLRASFEARTRHVKAEAAVTLRAVKRGYETQLAETQRRGEEKLLAASLRPSKALADTTNAETPAGGKRRNATSASAGDDPWGFLGEVEAEKEKPRGISPRRTRADGGGETRGGGRRRRRRRGKRPKGGRVLCRGVRRGQTTRRGGGAGNQRGGDVPSGDGAPRHQHPDGDADAERSLADARDDGEVRTRGDSSSRGGGTR